MPRATRSDRTTPAPKPAQRVVFSPDLDYTNQALPMPIEGAWFNHLKAALTKLKDNPPKDQTVEELKKAPLKLTISFYELSLWVIGEPNATIPFGKSEDKTHRSGFASTMLAVMELRGVKMYNSTVPREPRSMYLAFDMPGTGQKLAINFQKHEMTKDEFFELARQLPDYQEDKESDLKICWETDFK